MSSDKKEISPLTGKPVKQGSNRTGVKAGPNAKKPGPQPTEIEWDKIAVLAGLHCTQEEAAAFAGVSVQTLTARYAIEHDGETLGEFMSRNRDKGKAKLRRLQMESAQAGNVAMQIFLGKNWLGQSEKQEILGRFQNIITHETLLAQIEERNKIEISEATSERDDE